MLPGDNSVWGGRHSRRKCVALTRRHAGRHEHAGGGGTGGKRPRSPEGEDAVGNPHGAEHFFEDEDRATARTIVAMANEKGFKQEPGSRWAQVPPLVSMRADDGTLFLRRGAELAPAASNHDVPLAVRVEARTTFEIGISHRGVDARLLICLRACLTVPVSARLASFSVT